MDGPRSRARGTAALGLFLAFVWGEPAVPAAEAAPAGALATLGPARSVPRSVPGPEGRVVIRGDGSYENALAWQLEGAIAPDYGTFAVRFPEAVNGVIPAVVLDLTQDETFRDQVADVFVWDELDGLPGAVLSLLPEQGLSEAPPEWPDVARYVLALSDTVRCEQLGGAAAWAGFWGRWPGELAGWFVGADLDGLGSEAWTRIGPGLGFPSGWQHVSVAWGPVTALGIGVLLEPCDPEPVLETTWGRIKHLYARGKDRWND